MDKRPPKVFLCHAHADTLAGTGRNPVPQGDDMRALYTRLTKDGVDAWLDKAKPCGERSRTILPGQDWELEIRKAVRDNKLYN
jgi:hypothetical protein